MPPPCATTPTMSRGCVRQRVLDFGRVWGPPVVCIRPSFRCPDMTSQRRAPTRAAAKPVYVDLSVESDDDLDILPLQTSKKDNKRKRVCQAQSLRADASRSIPLPSPTAMLTKTYLNWEKRSMRSTTLWTVDGERTVPSRFSSTSSIGKATATRTAPGHWQTNSRTTTLLSWSSTRSTPRSPDAPSARSSV